jgi:hypothetical protein
MATAVRERRTVNAEQIFINVGGRRWCRRCLVSTTSRF